MTLPSLWKESSQGAELAGFIARAPAAMAMFDTAMRRLAASPRCEAMLGSALSAVTPELMQRWRDAARLLLDGAPTDAREERLIRAQDIIWLRWDMQSWRAADGSAGGVVLALEDVTARKMAEEALQESEQRFRALTELSPDAVLIVADDRIVFANRAAAALLRVDHPREIVGRSLLDLAEPGYQTRMRDRLNKVLHEQCAVPLVEYCWKRADGSRVHVEAAKGPIDWMGARAVQVAARDITERKRAEKALQTTTERLSLAQSAARIGIWDRDLLTNQCSVNDEYYALYGLPQAAKVGYKEFLALVHPDDVEQIEASTEAALAGRGAIDTECRIRRANDGAVRWIATKGRVTFDADGRPVRIMGAVYDITTLKEAERALQQAQEDFIHAQEVGQIGWWRLRLKENMLIFSEESHRIFGVPKETPLTYERFFEMVHPEDRDEVRRRWAATVIGEAYDIEHRIIVDGRVKWVREKAYLETDAGGALLGGFGIVQDITDRKQAEEALRRSEAEARRQRDELEWIYQNAPIGLCFLDRDLRYRRINRWLAEVNELPVEAHIGRTVAEIVPAVASMIEEAARKVLATGEAVKNHDVIAHTQAEAGVRYFTDCFYPAFGADGEVIGFGVVVEEITKNIRVEALREADCRKNEFLATLAHELRNPLVPIKNAIQALRVSNSDNAALQQENAVLLTMAERQVKHLVRLVNDLLEVTRISLGKIELRKEQTDLVTLLPQAVDLSQPEILAKGHRLIIDLPREPLLVDGDPVRLTQIFANLLNNAAKYTDSGGRIELTAFRNGADAVVTVRDNGIGIPKEMLDSIFDLFTQIDYGSDKSQGGIGIGLALAQGLVQLHGGVLKAKSDGPGKGSEFIARLPLAASQPADAKGATP